MGMFDGKKGLILGVANDRSIAWAIAQVIMDEGGVCGFSHLPDKPDDERQRNRRRVAKLHRCSIRRRRSFWCRWMCRRTTTSPRSWARPRQEFGQIDFLLHSIAFATLDDLKTRHDRHQPRRLQAGDGDQRVQPAGGVQRRARTS